jgi:hypothetical protein
MAKLATQAGIKFPLKTKTIKATFIGKSGSLGFVYGKEYELGLKGMTISYKREFSTVKCKYDSIEAFLNNWTDIITI